MFLSPTSKAQLDVGVSDALQRWREYLPNQMVQPAAEAKKQMVPAGLHS